jgi:hypothetical protein
LHVDLERLSSAARDFSVKGQIGSLLGRGPAREQRKPSTQPDNEVPFTVGA